MGVNEWLVGAAAVCAVGIAGECGLAGYFFRRTMIRSNAKRERTQDMAGTDWNAYIPGIQESKKWLADKPQEDVYITSADGLKLHGTYFPCVGSQKVVICFHGYTSEGLNDFSSIAKFYMEMGYHLLIVDERAHGKSEGTYIGFGCLDRHDAKLWIAYILNRLGADCHILLHGISMGAATVLMTTGLELPSQVKAAISDCAFTSAWEVFRSVLRTMYHLPPFPLMELADKMAKRKAGYGLDECNAREEVKKSKIPTLFIHGDADTFVPCSMVYEMYGACQAPKELLIIKGASHAEAYYKEPKSYEDAIRAFLEKAYQGEVQEA